MAIIKKQIQSLADVPEIPAQRLAWLKNLTDDEIDYSDIPDLADLNFWNKFEIKKTKSVKKQVNLRIDTDTLNWYKKQGKGYQTLMKKVLESYFKHHYQK
ncbi:MAG: BrnA antitoxin family protein [bacterium]